MTCSCSEVKIFTEAYWACRGERNEDNTAGRDGACNESVCRQHAATNQSYFERVDLTAPETHCRPRLTPDQRLTVISGRLGLLLRASSLQWQAELVFIRN